MDVEGRGSVDKPIEGDKVSHGSHSIIEDNIHSPAVYLRNEVAPVIYCTMVTVQEGEIQGPKAVT